MSDTYTAGSSLHDSIITSIATQYKMDEKEIRDIYETELKKLEIKSRIKSFLPVLCTRHVKETIIRNHDIKSF